MHSYIVIPNEILERINPYNQQKNDLHLIVFQVRPTQAEDFVDHCIYLCLDRLCSIRIDAIDLRLFQSGPGVHNL